MERVSLEGIEPGPDNLGSGRLTAMLSVAVDVWIGNAAAVLSGCWGAVTRRAHETGYSRTSISHHAQRVEQAVINAQAGGLSYEALWAEHERLRVENEALWEAWVGATLLPEAKQHAFAATGSAMGLSLGQIITLLAIFLPNGAVPSRATVGRCVERVVADAGKGIARGVQLANEARVDAAQEPAAARAIALGLDVFHTQREIQRIVHGQWRRAERLLEAAAQADTKVVQRHQRGRDARGVAKQAWWAWRKAEQMFDAAVQADAAAARIETALALFRPEGCLRDRQWAQGHIRAALAELHGPEWGKVRRLLSDQRTLHHLDWVQEQLTQAVAGGLHALVILA